MININNVEEGDVWICKTEKTIHIGYPHKIFVGDKVEVSSAGKVYGIKLKVRFDVHRGDGTTAKVGSEIDGYLSEHDALKYFDYHGGGIVMPSLPTFKPDLAAEWS